MGYHAKDDMLSQAGRQDKPLPGREGAAYDAALFSPHPAMEKKAFINVDELMLRITLQQAATFYGIALPELKRIGSETRTSCFLNCGKEKETGDRALAIQEGDPSRKWKCHQ